MHKVIHCLSVSLLLCSVALGKEQDEKCHVRALVTTAIQEGRPNTRKFLRTMQRDIFPRRRSNSIKESIMKILLSKIDPRITTQGTSGTKESLLEKLDIMVSEANYTEENRTLLFYFTGHGREEGMRINGRSGRTETVNGDILLSKIHTISRKGVAFIAITDACCHGNLMDLPLKLQHPNVSSVSWKGAARDGPLILHIASCRRTEVSVTCPYQGFFRAGFVSFTKTLCDHGPDLSSLIKPQNNMYVPGFKEYDHLRYRTLDHDGRVVKGQTPVIACTQPLDFKKLGGVAGLLKMPPTELFIEEYGELTNRVKSKYLTDFEDPEGSDVSDDSEASDDSEVSDDSDDSQLDANGTDDPVNLSQVAAVGVVLSVLAWAVSYILV
jgi:hypothetical protein